MRPASLILLGVLTLAAVCNRTPAPLAADTFIYKSPDNDGYRPTFTRGTAYPPDMNPEAWGSH